MTASFQSGLQLVSAQIEDLTSELRRKDSNNNQVANDLLFFQNLSEEQDARIRHLQKKNKELEEEKRHMRQVLV